MATTWTIHPHEFSVARTDARSVATLGLSAALPMAAYFVAELLGEASGLVPVVNPPMGLPDWTVAGAMMLTLPMWGIARWTVGQRGDAGRVASRWIVALIAGVILLPSALSFANPLMASLLFMLVLLTGIIAAMRAAALSGTAVALLAPGLVWFGLGSLIGFTTLAGGWSPPFALVDHNRH